MATAARARVDQARARIEARERFRASQRVEAAFERQLGGVARQINLLVRGVVPTAGRLSQADLQKLRDLLRRYAQTLEPWAEAVVGRMQAELSQRDAQAWFRLGDSLGRNLRGMINDASVGRSLREMMQEQVKLITSMPIQAAQRVQDLTFKLFTQSGRAAELHHEIMRTGAVSLGRAKTIARTQVGTTASNLTQVRSLAVGAITYHWRTARDRDVRPFHKRLEGKVIAWDNPPVVDEHGRRAHAGTDYNCRCYPEPIIPDLL